MVRSVLQGVGMAIQIPTTGIPANPIVEFHKNDLVNPPAAPSVVENLKAIDPRVALNMPLPVTDANQGAATQSAIQNPVLKGSQLAEPEINQAVLLELSKTQAQMNLATTSVVADTKSSLSRLDNLGSAALGQLLSNILDVDELDLTLVQNNKLNTATANWPTTNREVALSTDPRAAMNILYQNLQNSGLFAGEQIKKLLMPAALSIDEDIEAMPDGDVAQQATTLLGQMNSETPQVRDAVKLLLRGDLAWYGLVLPNVYARIEREDAWQQSAEDLSQVIKGTRITMEMELPHLGKLKVIGTQFGEVVNLTIETNSEVKAILANQLTTLEEQIRERVKSQTHVAIHDGITP